MSYAGFGSGERQRRSRSAGTPDRDVVTGIAPNGSRRSRPARAAGILPRWRPRPSILEIGLVLLAAAGARLGRPAGRPARRRRATSLLGVAVSPFTPGYRRRPRSRSSCSPTSASCSCCSRSASRWTSRGSDASSAASSSRRRCRCCITTAVAGGAVLAAGIAPRVGRCRSGCASRCRRRWSSSTSPAAAAARRTGRPRTRCSAGASSRTSTGVALAALLLAAVGAERPARRDDDRRPGAVRGGRGRHRPAAARSCCGGIRDQHDSFLIVSVASGLTIAGPRLGRVPRAAGARGVRGRAGDHGEPGDRAEVRRRLLPFRDLLAVLFFVAIGMLLDPNAARCRACRGSARFLALIVVAKVGVAYCWPAFAVPGGAAAAARGGPRPDRRVQLRPGVGARRGRDDSRSRLRRAGRRGRDLHRRQHDRRAASWGDGRPRRAGLTADERPVIEPSRDAVPDWRRCRLLTAAALVAVVLGACTSRCRRAPPPSAPVAVLGVGRPIGHGGHRRRAGAIRRRRQRKRQDRRRPPGLRRRRRLRRPRRLASASSAASAPTPSPSSVGRRLCRRRRRPRSRAVHRGGPIVPATRRAGPGSQPRTAPQPARTTRGPWTATGHYAYLYGGRDGAHGLRRPVALRPRDGHLAALWSPRTSRRPASATPRRWVPDYGLVVFAGQAGSGFFNDLWAYDAEANTWTATAVERARSRRPATGRAPGSRRTGACGSATASPTRAASSTPRAYDFANGTWADLSREDPVPVIRCLHDCLWTGRRALRAVRRSDQRRRGARRPVGPAGRRRLGKRSPTRRSRRASCTR